jgi:hypothetical protein
MPRLGLAQGDSADIIADARDAVRFEVKLTEDVLPGSIFVPFHSGAQRHAGGAINTALDTEADPAPASQV